MQDRCALDLVGLAKVLLTLKWYCKAWANPHQQMLRDIFVRKTYCCSVPSGSGSTSSTAYLRKKSRVRKLDADLLEILERERTDSYHPEYND